MATKYSDPIIIYDDDYDGGYVLSATRKVPHQSSWLSKVLLIGLVIANVVIFIAIVCRSVNRLGR